MLAHHHQTKINKHQEYKWDYVKRLHVFAFFCYVKFRVTMGFENGTAKTVINIIQWVRRACTSRVENSMTNI